MPDSCEGRRFLENRKNCERELFVSYREMERNLGRLRRFLAFLHLPAPGTCLIHIAGTKGKSSTAMILEKIFRDQGYRTGLFTSPHILRLEERFAVNGTPSSSEDLEETLLVLKSRLEAFEKEEGEGDIPFTFFELTVPAAFLLFDRKRADCIILETGLGGRIDATNICSPDLTILTSLGYEHQALLGDTLEEIAEEKGGIIKSGVPVISGIGAQLASLPSETENAKLPRFLRKGALSQEELERGIRRIRQIAGKKNAPWFSVDGPDSETSAAMADWVGAAQPLNGQLAVTAAEILARSGKFSGTREDALKSLAALRLPARGKVLRESPVILADGAHTRASARSLAESIAKRWPHLPKTLIIGFLADKDAEGILWELLPYFDRVLLAEIPNSNRGLDVKELKERAEKLLPLIPAGKRPEIGFAGDIGRLSDRMCSGERDRLYCWTGSFYLASAAVKELICRNEEEGI